MGAGGRGGSMGEVLQCGGRSLHAENIYIKLACCLRCLAVGTIPLVQVMGQTSIVKSCGHPLAVKPAMRTRQQSHTSPSKVSAACSPHSHISCRHRHHCPSAKCSVQLG